MIITISASYAAGGSELGPQVAQRLGYRFIDRAVPAAVANDLGISLDDALAVEQGAPSRWWSFFAGLSSMSAGLVPAPVEQTVSERDLITSTEAELHRVADEGDVVILGHAAAVVLANRSDVLHVRLDGPRDGRMAAAMQQHGIDAVAAAAAQKDNDKIRSGYAKHFYQVDSSDAGLYHLVIDTVYLRWDLAEELIVQAARSTFAGSVGPDESSAETSR